MLAYSNLDEFFLICQNGLEVFSRKVSIYYLLRRKQNNVFNVPSSGFKIFYRFFFQVSL